jgi:hypothetical protein
MSKSEDNPDMKVLKKASCKSLSGKSSLTYEIALDQDNEIHVRIIKNTGGGFYSPEFVSLGDIRSVMEEHPAGTPVSSFLLQPLFYGKSVNTPAFLLAALANEKLLVPMTGKKRSLEPAEDFTAMVEKMTSSTSSAKKKVTTKRPTKKATIKKKAMARKKTVRTV